MHCELEVQCPPSIRRRGSRCHVPPYSVVLSCHRESKLVQRNAILLWHYKWIEGPGPESFSLPLCRIGNVAPGAGEALASRSHQSRTLGSEHKKSTPASRSTTMHTVAAASEATFSTAFCRPDK